MVTALPEQVASVTVVVMGECEARKAGYKAGYGRLCGSKLHLATAGYCLFFAWFEINWLLVIVFADERFREAFRILLARRRRARPNAADFVCARRLRGSTE